MLLLMLKAELECHMLVVALFSASLHKYEMK
jgi:hypothetical protein